MKRMAITDLPKSEGMRIRGDMITTFTFLSGILILNSSLAHVVTHPLEDTTRNTGSLHFVLCPLMNLIL